MKSLYRFRRSPGTMRLNPNRSGQGFRESEDLTNGC